MEICVQTKAQSAARLARLEAKGKYDTVGWKMGSHRFWPRPLPLHLQSAWL